MPTYRNDSENAYKVLNLNNVEQIVQPGESVLTYQILTVSGLTKIAEAPYFNPSEGVHVLSSTGPGDDKTVNLDASTKEIELWNGSAVDITVFLRATANTPGLLVLAESVRNISGLEDMVDEIILQFSAAGQCYLTELKG